MGRRNRNIGTYKGYKFRVEKSGIVALTPLSSGVNFIDLKAFKNAVNAETL